MKRLFTLDPKAVNHVLMNNYIYQKPTAARYHLSQILGNGVLVVEEDKHKQQVRNSMPLFHLASQHTRLSSGKLWQVDIRMQSRKQNNDIQLLVHIESRLRSSSNS